MTFPMHPHTESTGKCGRCDSYIFPSDLWSGYAYIKTGTTPHALLNSVLSRFGGKMRELEKHPLVQHANGHDLELIFHNNPLPPIEWAGRSEATEGKGGITGAVNGPFGGPAYHVSWETDRSDKDKSRHSPYKLCSMCHNQLVELISNFFFGEKQNVEPAKAA